MNNWKHSNGRPEIRIDEHGRPVVVDPDDDRSPEAEIFRALTQSLSPRLFILRLKDQDDKVFVLDVWKHLRAGKKMTPEQADRLQKIGEQFDIWCHIDVERMLDPNPDPFLCH